MNHNITSFFFSSNGELAHNDHLGDTALRLDCLGYSTSKMTRSANSHINNDVFSAQVPDDNCKLVLGLGPTPSSYSGDYYPHGVNKSKEPSAIFAQGLTSEGDPGLLKLGLSRGSGEVFGVCENSAARNDLNKPYLCQRSADENRAVIPIVDEGSTSAKKSGGYMPSLLLAPRLDSNKALAETQELLELGSKNKNHGCPHLSPEPSATTDYSMGTISEPTTTRTSSDQRGNHPKKCKFDGCSKGARGASGLCIAHGSGQRCQKPGCNKGAESRTAYCKAHGGGRRCQRLGCTKSAEGKTDYCIAHGGGRRCGHQGCSKAARGKSGLCIRHGGGKRRKVDGCTFKYSELKHGSVDFLGSSLESRT